jgi:hypothetical protein
LTLLEGSAFCSYAASSYVGPVGRLKSGTFSFVTDPPRSVRGSLHVMMTLRKFL